MYGDCRKTNLAADAGEIVWLPKKYGKTITFSKVNGAASELQKVSNELDQLPDQFLGYLRPLQGTFNCRTVAGTNRLSSHGTGTAIDLAKAHCDYWRWSKPDASGRIIYKNQLPWEIVRIFEKLQNNRRGRSPFSNIIFLFKVASLCRHEGANTKDLQLQPSKTHRDSLNHYRS